MLILFTGLVTIVHSRYIYPKFHKGKKLRITGLKGGETKTYDEKTRLYREENGGWEYKGFYAFGIGIKGIDTDPNMFDFFKIEDFSNPPKPIPNYTTNERQLQLDACDRKIKFTVFKEDGTFEEEQPLQCDDIIIDNLNNDISGLVEIKYIFFIFC